MSIRYTSDDQLVSGMPAGGIGCGVVQVFSDGTRGQFTGLNNWEQPLGQLHWFRAGTASDYRHANPFGIFVAWKDRRVAKLLQRTALGGLPIVEQMTLEADFPVAELSVHDPEIPIDVTLRHFSPFIPRESRLSSLPVVISVVRLRNPMDCPVTVSVLACCLNVVGSWNVGRYNRIVTRGRLVGLECRRRHSDARDVRAGELALVTDTTDAEVTYLASWMYAKEPFRANAEDRRLEAWDAFAKDGRLANLVQGPEAMGEFDEPMGALAVRCRLEPHQSREVAFCYSWFMPNHLYGHRYERWFKSAWKVAASVHLKRDRLLEQTRAWQTTIRSAGLPEWLADGLINTLTPYTAGSWWTRDGRFAIYENPVKWPLMDSLDVRYYGTLPLACWFPELEQSTMRQFAKAQRADGRIPHDLGKSQLECPSDGTTAGRPWKDLATKFALMAYRDVLWSGDRQFLTRIYPSVARAMRWELTTDRNGDGLPDNEGQDSTYDLWPFYGASAYTASIFLASLRATERLARMMKDQAMVRLCQQAFRRGAQSFEAKLWNGSYYLAARQDDGSTYDACIVGQLNGQWYAHLLDLGYLVPADHARKAVERILTLNGSASRFGAVNSVFPDGRIDTSSHHAKNIWVGETYALCALAIYEGFTAEGLALAQKVWLTFANHTKNVWSQPDVLVAEDGSLSDGEFYVRNVAIWAIPFALARSDARVRQMLTALAPTMEVKVS